MSFWKHLFSIPDEEQEEQINELDVTEEEQEDEDNLQA